MGYVKPVETDQINLPSDNQYWVRLKRVATFGDQLAAQSAMLKMDSSAGTVSQMEWRAYLEALSVSMIVEWNLTDEDERPLPINAENLGRLSADDGQFLANAVTERAKTRGVERERPFEPTSTAS